MIKKKKKRKQGEQSNLLICVRSSLHNHWSRAVLHNLHWVRHVEEPELPVHRCPRGHPVVISCRSILDDGFLKPHRHTDGLFLTTLKTASRPSTPLVTWNGCTVMRRKKKGLSRLKMSSKRKKTNLSCWSCHRWKSGTLLPLLLFFPLHSFLFTSWSCFF